MADKRVISIRFHMDCKEDKELYQRLEQEAGSSISLASVVKAKIRESYNREDMCDKDTGLQDRLVAVIREEIQELGMKLVGAFLSGMRVNQSNNTTVVPVSVVDIGNLPEKSEELPLGALDFLE